MSRSAILIPLLAAAAMAQTPFAVDDFTGHRSQTRIRQEATAAATNAGADCTTTGQQNIAVITVTTPANPALPAAWSNSNIENAYFAPSGLSLNTYWQDASYGQTSATGQIFGPFALTKNYDCSDLDGLAAAAIAAAGSALNLPLYTRLAIIFPVQSCVTPDLGNVGGYGSIGCFNLSIINSSLNQNASVAWLPIFPNWSTPTNSIGILAHEHGHNLGLDHSNTETFTGIPLGPPDSAGTNTEYGDPFSVMGNANILSTNLAIGQYTGEHKALELNWLQQTEVMTSGSYTLAPFESSSGTRALRVLRDPVAGSWLWAEYRQRLGVVDSTLANLPGNIFDGVLVHYENPELDSLHTYLLDYGNSFSNPVLTAGQTWSDPNSPLTITANTSNSLAVTYVTSCATLTLNTSSIAVTALDSCSWNATTSTSWIRFTGATSGTGNGSVPFAESPNTATSQRLGYVTVNGHSLAIIQPGTGISITGVNPAVISGNSGKVSFYVADPAGTFDIAELHVTFSGPESCVVTVETPSQLQPQANFFLTADNGGLMGPTTTGTLSNSVCSIIGAGSSVSTQGTQLTLTLNMSFSSTAFAGSHSMYILGQSRSGGLAALTIGTWTVGNQGVPAPAITPIGVVPVGSTTTVISPGTWISIYGTNLTSPSTLGGVSVLIDGKPAYLTYASPTQINAEVPQDTNYGPVTVQVSSATSTVTLAELSPAWIPLPSTNYAIAEIPGPNYTYSIASATQPITPGTTIELFGVGFGPTNPPNPAGPITTVDALTANRVRVKVGGADATVTFAGLIERGLFQINVVIPAGLSAGNQTLVATVGGVSTPDGVFLPIGN